MTLALGCGSDADSDHSPSIQPRLIAVGRDGRIASLDLGAPWSVRAAADLRATISSARCRNGRCVVVHPWPANSLSVVDATSLMPFKAIDLPRDSDPRDVALVDDHVAVVSLYERAELMVVDLDTEATESIDLGVLADDDGLPEAKMLANCGRRVFAQLQRVDHKSGAGTPGGSVLAVIDLDRPASLRVIDADTATDGSQGIALAGKPDFDMPVDCDSGRLYVSEPRPLMQGGSLLEEVDLRTLRAMDFPFATGAQGGGFEVVTPTLVWIITHTEFGPGPSSHLNLVGGPPFDTYNTFADEHVDNLALDRGQGLLFFPDPCRVRPANPSCDGGIHVFDARRGTLATPRAVTVDFLPIEVAISR